MKNKFQKQKSSKQMNRNQKLNHLIHKRKKLKKEMEILIIAKSNLQMI